MALREERERLLRTVIGIVGQGPVIEPPFNFQYGCNIAIGDSFYANVKLVASLLCHYSIPLSSKAKSLICHFQRIAYESWTVGSCLSATES